MHGFLFSVKDTLQEKVDQKDCVDVLRWARKNIFLDKRALDMKKAEANDKKKTAHQLARKRQYDEATELQDEAVQILNDVAVTLQMYETCRSVETLAKRCHDAWLAEEDYQHAKEWNHILVACADIHRRRG